MARKHFIKRMTGWVVTLAFAYLVFVLALGLMQKNLMYFPDPARFVPADWALRELKPLDAKTEDGLSITSWYVPAKQRDRFTIVFLQGNAGHLGYRNYKVRPWIDEGYGVLMVGYRGFGNEGKPSEQGLYRDARAAINALLERGVPSKALVFYGESMGTGVAVQMATEFDGSGLVLESPYTSIPDVAADRYPMVPVDLLLGDHYDSLSKIGDVHMPLLLLHGEKDQVVPVKFGRELFEAANEPKQAEFIPEAGHSDVYSLLVQQIVLNFLAKLPTDPLLQAPPGASKDGNVH